MNLSFFQVREFPRTEKRGRRRKAIFAFDDAFFRYYLIKTTVEEAIFESSAALIVIMKIKTHLKMLSLQIS